MINLIFLIRIINPYSTVKWHQNLYVAVILELQTDSVFVRIRVATMGNKAAELFLADLVHIYFVVYS